MKGNRQDMYYSNWFIKVNFAAAENYIINVAANLNSIPLTGDFPQEV